MLLPSERQHHWVFLKSSAKEQDFSKGKGNGITEPIFKQLSILGGYDCSYHV